MAPASLIQCADDFGRTLLQQRLCYLRAECFRLFRRTAGGGADQLPSVRQGNEAAQRQHSSVQFGKAAQRYLAAAIQAPAHFPFGPHAGGGIGIVQRCQTGKQVGTIGTDFDAQRTLADCRQAVAGFQQRGNALGQSQPAQSGSGENDRIVLAFVELAQPGLHVAAQRFDSQMGIAGANLAFAPQAGSANHRARRQLFQTGIAHRNESVARIFAFEYGDFTLQNYAEVLGMDAVIRAFINSFLVATVATIVSIGVTVSSGYMLSRFKGPLPRVWC